MKGNLQAHNLSGDSVGPGHEKRELSFGAVDGSLWDVVDSHVGLVEHVTSSRVRLWLCDGRSNLRIPVQTEQVAQRGIPSIRQQVIEGALSTRSIDPFLQRARWQVAVVIDDTSPSRHDIDTSIAVSSHSGIQRPESAVRVE